MTISLGWLADYCDIPFDAAELARRLTFLGLEVESISDKASGWKNIVVGKALTVIPHPNADKLRLVTVDAGTGSDLHIVCGAPNVAEGQKIAVALIGAQVGDLKIKKSKIRGETSEGMICSARELGLSEDHSGILVLDENAVVGSPLADALGVTDVTFEVGITPNRADCLSHFGIAREAVIAGASNFRQPNMKREYLDTSKTKIEDVLKITLTDSKLCPRYAARIVRGVNVKESPDWLKRRLESVGLRPRNNIVDITNFVLMECGHPLHAFDLDAVKDHHIIVRTAHNFADTFTTLDSKERKLPPDALLISDPDKPLAIAGVMGGENSEINDATTDVLIESAYFDPSSIRRTAKLLGLSTDASYRFERGTDIDNVIYAVDRAAALIAELAGGEVLHGILDAYPIPKTQPNITFRPDRARKIIGIDSSDDEILSAVKKASITVNADGTLKPPSFRVDITSEIDIIEEAARIIGYDNIPSSLSEPVSLQGERNVLPLRTFENRLRTHLAGLGFTECISTPLTSNASAILFHPSPVEVMNPLTSVHERMRTSILINLAEAAQRNERHNASGQRLFELGSVFAYSNSRQQLGNVIERREIGILIKDIIDEKNPYNTAPMYADLFHLRTVIEQLCAGFGLRSMAVEPLNETIMYLDGSESLMFSLNGVRLAVGGKLAENVVKHFDLRSGGYAAVIDTDALYQAAATHIVQPRLMSPLPKYPSIDRDIAVTLDHSIPAASIINAVRNAIPAEFNPSVRIFDEFRSKEMTSAGQRSIGIRIILRSDDKTLSDEDAERISGNVVSILAKDFNAKLRMQ
jgi:phenylalanyl-tRNA synthetase beta chain